MEESWTKQKTARRDYRNGPRGNWIAAGCDSIGAMVFSI